MAEGLSLEPKTSAGSHLKKERTARWQKITLAALFTGYAGYYVCRSNLSVSTPSILREYEGAGVTKEDIGNMVSLGVLSYAFGKFTNGLLTDFLGGRGLFLLGMVLSVVCTIGFGLASGLAAFTVIWIVNRYCQSVGWGALMKITSRWFPVRLHATVMGVLSMSYLFGDALVRIYLGTLMEMGLNWRSVFFVAAATLLCIAAACSFVLKTSPRDVGGEEPAGNPANLFAAAGDSTRPDSLAHLLMPFFSNPTFYLICVMSFGLTLIRETFNSWTPTYLREVAGLSEGESAQWSMVFPLVGGISALVGGALSDRFQGKHGRVALPSLIILCGALWLLSTSAHDHAATALLLIGMVSFFLIAPYSLCAGVMALDLGGKKGSSTAAGLIDTAGYLGAIFSGRGIAYLAENYGWAEAFLVLAGIAGLTAIAAALYWLQQEFGKQPTAVSDKR